MAGVDKVVHRPLGSQGLVVSIQGVGCNGMTEFCDGSYVAGQEAESIRTIGQALDLGINFFDTAWNYGGQYYPNEQLVGKAISLYGREKFVIATKFGIVPCHGGRRISGSEETIRSQLADSLRRLGIDYIDLYYMHRMDPDTPIEETMHVLKSLVEAGSIRYIGLSDCTPSEMRRAHAVHPLTAIQMEWSLQTRTIEAEIVPTARELGIGIVTYCPLGRGLLSGKITSRENLPQGDWRLSLPRFQSTNISANIPRTSFIELAQQKACTPAQLALAWLHAQGNDVFPIPGTKSSTRVVENAAATFIQLSKVEMKAIEEAVPLGKGERYAGSPRIQYLFDLCIDVLVLFMLYYVFVGAALASTFEARMK